MRRLDWWAAAALVLIVAAIVALAGCGGDTSSSGIHVAPEIDPTGAVAGLTLLAGIVAVIRGRRS